MNMGLVNSHIAHWMQQPTGNSTRNVSLGTPRTVDVCLNVILLHVMFSSAKDKLCITAPPGSGSIFCDLHLYQFFRSSAGYQNTSF